MLRSFDRHAGGSVDVPDPFNGDEIDFESCLDMVEAGCRGLAVAPGEVVRRNRVRYARRSRPSVVRATRRSLPCVTRSRRTSPAVARWARPSACWSKDSPSSIWSGDGPTRRGPVNGRPRRWSTSTRSGSPSWACSRSSWSIRDRSGSTTRSPRSGRSSRPGERTGATIRHALCHRAGVPAIREPLTNQDLWEWDRMAGALAATEPWFEPGTRHVYHTNTYGHLVGEIVRRVGGGSSPGERLKSVVGPLGADIHFGVSPADLARCADVVWAGGIPPEPLDFSSLHGDELMTNLGLLQPPRLFVDGGGQHDSSGGGRRSPRPTATRRPKGWPVSTRHSSSPAAPVGRLAGRGDLGAIGGVLPGARGRGDLRPGVQADRPASPVRSEPRSFGHFGTGGALGFADPTAGVAFGYVMNRVIPRWQSSCNRALIDALYECL